MFESEGYTEFGLYRLRRSWRDVYYRQRRGKLFEKEKLFRRCCYMCKVGKPTFRIATFSTCTEYYSFILFETIIPMQWYRIFLSSGTTIQSCQEAVLNKERALGYFSSLPES